jgi:hypothetical protein
MTNCLPTCGLCGDQTDNLYFCRTCEVQACGCCVGLCEGCGKLVCAECANPESSLDPGCPRCASPQGAGTRRSGDDILCWPGSGCPNRYFVNPGVCYFVNADHALGSFPLPPGAGAKRIDRGNDGKQAKGGRT